MGEEDHWKELLVGHLRCMYEDQRYVDIILQCHGSEFPAHRLILTAFSKSITVLLQVMPDMYREDGPLTLSLDSLGLAAPTLNAVLNYMYTGHINTDVTIMEDIKHAASVLGVNIPELQKCTETITQCPTEGVNCNDKDNFKNIEFAESDDETDNYEENNDENNDDYVPSQIELSTEAGNEQQKKDIQTVVVSETKIKTETLTDEEFVEGPRGVKDECCMQAAAELESGESKAERKLPGVDLDDKVTEVVIKRKRGRPPLHSTVRGICRRARKQSFPLKATKLRIREKASHRCSICNKEFFHLSKLKTHSIVHTGIRPLKCEDCGQGFIQKCRLDKHRHKKHSQNSDCVCKKCGVSFSSYLELRKHMIEHTGDRTHVCPICKQGFFRPVALRYHQERVHGIKVERRKRKAGEKSHKCTQCGKEYLYLSRLNEHMAIHTGVKPHICDRCGKGFYRLSELNGHMSRHEDIDEITYGKKDVTHKCTFCGKEFAFASRLKEHVVIHTGERTHVCEKCGTTFNRATHLRRHLRKQHGEVISNKGDGKSNIRYTCSVCFLEFPDPSNLKQHLDIHTQEGDNIHMCKHCGKVFTRARYLPEHMKYRCKGKQISNPDEGPSQKRKRKQAVAPTIAVHEAGTHLSHRVMEADPNCDAIMAASQPQQQHPSHHRHPSHPEQQPQLQSITSMEDLLQRGEAWPSQVTVPAPNYYFHNFPHF